MGLHHSGKSYILDVEGHLDRGGTWLVEATLRFREGTHGTLGQRLFGVGRIALIQAVIEEGAKGRARGAHTVRVLLDIDGETRELGLDELLGHGKSIH